jgi:hypothetical protein
MAARLRDEAALRALLDPVAREVRVHLGAYPPRMRACLALALAADLLSEATSLALDVTPSEDAARLIELAGRVDAVVAELWQSRGRDGGADTPGP